MFNPSVTDSFDEMAFHCNYPIHRACRDGDVQTVSMALSSDPCLSIAEDCFKHLTPIHWAATFGKVSVMANFIPPPPIFNSSFDVSFLINVIIIFASIVLKQK